MPAPPPGFELDEFPDMSSRPPVFNEDGSVSTVRTIGVGDERGEWVIPTVVDGKIVNNDEAINLWRSGSNNAVGGPFKSVDEANSYAQRLHESESKRVGRTSQIPAPPNGFLLDSDIPPPPEGFELDGVEAFTPPENFINPNAGQIPDLQATTRGMPQLRTPGPDALSNLFRQAAQEPNPTISEPLRAILPSDLGPEQSIVGLYPEAVPTGAEMTASTGIPKAITIPVSGAGRAAAGLGQFMTSPAGMVEQGIAAVPGVGLVQRAKWILDMAKGFGETAGTLEAKIEQAIADPSKADWQGVAEDAANTTLMLYGAGKLSAHEVSRVTGIRAPIGRFAESLKTRLSKDLAQELLKAALMDAPSVIPAPNRELGLRIPEGPFANPEIPALADAALREAQQRIVVPGQEGVALGELRRAIEPPQIQPSTIATAERPGGGEARFGKTSYMRPAKDVLRAADERQQLVYQESLGKSPSPNAQPTEAATVPEPLKPTSQVTEANAPVPPVAESVPPKVTESQAAPDLISKLESLKFDESGQGRLYSLPHPDAIVAIGKTAWNNAIDLAIVGIKAGKTVKVAIDDAIGYIRKNSKGKYDETQIRNNLESIIASEGVEAKPGVGETKPVEAIREDAGGRDVDGRVRESPELGDIYKIFEPKPKTPFSPKQKAIDIIEAVRTGISSKFRPINKLAEDIAKSYGRTSSKDVAGVMEQLKGSQGKAEAEIYRFDQDVSKLVRGSEKDFNAYLFLRRSIDRLQSDILDIEKAKAGGDVKTLNRKRVADYTIPQLESKLATLKEKIGPEKLADFEKASKEYQTYMDESLRLQVESGRMSPEIYNLIKKGNQFYAPFKVMKWIEETSKPEGAGAKPIDTKAEFTKAIEGIDDKDFRLGDMLGAARQNILMSRILADKNVAMRHVAELAALDVEGRFIKRLGPKQEPPQGMEAVNVLEEGKTQRYAVNRDVAEAVKIYGGNAGGVMVRLLSYMSVPFKAGATALNLPFQISNLMADVPRQALVSKYGIRSPADLVRYPLDFVHSLFSSISGDVFGRDNKLFQDFLDSGVAGTTIAEHLTPDALKFKEPSTMSTANRIGWKALTTIPEFAKAIEQTSKVMGVKRAMRFENATSGAQLARQMPKVITELRRFSGSPDFGRQGKWIENARLNLLHMFLNARIQGVIADVGRLGGRDGASTAAKTWLKVASAVGIPTAYLYYLNNSPEYKEDYAKRSQQEKQNYWLIPKDSFITTEDGQKIRDYWRIPKREVSKWVSNLTESSLDFADKKDPQAAADFGKQMLQELSPINIAGNSTQERLESSASGLNPIIKAPLELATGRDLYRHRELMSDQLRKASPEEQYTERTATAFKNLAVAMPDVAPEFLRSPIILENLTRNLTAGLLTQFLPRQPVRGRSKLENTPLLQRFQALPYEDNTKFKEELINLERSAADEQLNRHRAAVKLLDTSKNIEEAAQKANGDVRLIKHLVDLHVSKENGATMADRQLLSLPAKQRAEYVKGKLEGLSPTQKEARIQEFARKRILTEAVLQELPEVFK